RAGGAVVPGRSDQTGDSRERARSQYRDLWWVRGGEDGDGDQKRPDWNTSDLRRLRSRNRRPGAGPDRRVDQWLRAGPRAGGCPAAGGRFRHRHPGGQRHDRHGGEVDAMTAWRELSSPATAEDVAWLLQDELSSAGAARRAAEQLAQDIGLPPARVAEVGLAVTELATNVHLHGGGGAILLRSVRAGASAAVEVVAVDSGPGIADVGIARRDGHSTAGTLGIGLGMVTRLADRVDIASAPGRGTVLAARFEADREARPTLAADAVGPPAAGISRALSGEDVC